MSLLFALLDAGLEGAATLEITTAANLTADLSLSASITVEVTTSAALFEPLTGTASLTVTTAAALTVPKPLVGSATLTVTTAAELDGPGDFLDTVEIARLINGGAFRFLDQVHIAQGGLIDFTDTVAIARALQDFTDRLRILPDVATLFAEDLQRPVGHIDQP